MSVTKDDARIGSCDTSTAMSSGGAELYER
jgi:hypothetical protein